MYKQCFLKYGIAEILFYKRLDQVFALKCAAKLFKSAKFLNPSDKIKSSTRCFKSLLKGLKSSTECLKSLTTCLCYITTSAVLIRFFNPNLGGEVAIPTFCSIQRLVIRNICAKFGIPNLPQSQDIGQNLDMGISNLWISGQSIINKNCHNSRIRNDIQMKLKLVTKLGKRNTATLTMTNYQQILTL